MKTLRKIINILFILTFMLLIFLIGKGIFNSVKSNSVYSEIQQLSPIKKTNLKDKKTSYNDLLSINSDYKFRLKINNTNIDYPVVKGKDNTFYLENDFYKKPLSDGSIFLDYKNNFAQDFNNIIFGHNMKNSNMFSNLNKFKDENFFKNNNEITITDKEYTYTYKVFSVYVLDSKENIDYLYDINNSEITNIKKDSYLNLLKAKSMFKSPDITLSSNILTLITCSYEFDDAKTIVHANLIDKTKNS
ncbi:MAG: class B sortase [Sarcina sp.]